jgi:tRNA threonylcarbamoyladenosine modification (KEOPS) complex Cgi121 subunit
VASMQRDRSFHCACWEVGVKPDEVEDILSKMRKHSPNAIIQVFSAERAPSARAVEMIAAQTLTAARSGATLAERPELDLLLRLAGTRQIGEAFKRVGYKSNGKRLFMVAASEGSSSPLLRVSKVLTKDRRFSEVPKKKPAKSDLDLVERAALLAARL